MQKLYENKPGTVNVTVSGDDPHAVKTSAAVIGDALVSAGFDSVSVSNPFNPQPEGSDYLPSAGSLLDLMRIERPNVFKRPVVVQYLVEEDDGRARMGHIDDALAQRYRTPESNSLPELEAVAVAVGLSEAAEVALLVQEIEAAVISPAQEEALDSDAQADYLSPADEQLAVDAQRDRNGT